MAQQQARSLEEAWRNREAEIPAQRFGTVAEFGDACAFLCAAQAGYVTGQNWLVDGGLYPGTY